VHTRKRAIAIPVRVKESGRVKVCQSMTVRPIRRKPRTAIDAISRIWIVLEGAIAMCFA
jgi:hypothetical protein